MSFHLSIGMLSDSLQLRYGDDSLRYAIVAGTSFYVIAAILFFIASKYLQDDWEE